MASNGDRHADGMGHGRGMRYAGGQECPDCGSTLGIADRFCRWCGRRLQEVPES